MTRQAPSSDTTHSVARVVEVDGDALEVIVEGVRRQLSSDQELQVGDWVTLRDERCELLCRPARPPSARDDWSRLHAHGGRLYWAQRERSLLLHCLRSWMYERDFLELDTPAMAVCPGVELHLDAVEASVREGMGGEPTQRWLITSPEFHVKRLLSAGVGSAYRLGKAFRSGERGPWHNPEFCMLEWYRVASSYVALVEDFMSMAASCHEALSRSRVGRGLPPLPPLGQLSRVSFVEAASRWAGVDIHDAEPADLRHRLKRAGVDVRADDDVATMLTQLMVEKIEPSLPHEQIIVIDRWPIELASLAQPSPHDARLAQRFEIYFRGVELANGFDELTDPEEQRSRFEADLMSRQRLGRPIYPVDERFLSALEVGCPPSSGVALGVDRLLMVLGGYRDIAHVLAFPFELA